MKIDNPTKNQLELMLRRKVENMMPEQRGVYLTKVAGYILYSDEPSKVIEYFEHRHT